MADAHFDAVAKIKEAGDIVQLIGETVALKKSGANYLGLCPFHGEKTPSFSVNPDKQFFHCFGCEESGDIFDFIMKSQGADFLEALSILADRYGVVLPEKREGRKEKEIRARRNALFAISEQAANVFEKYLYEGRNAGAAHTYLRKRGVSGAVARRFKLGYAPAPAAEGWNFLGMQFSHKEIAEALEVGLLVEKEHGGCYDRFRDRIVFPIYTFSGQICGFGGRIVGEGQPKYLNSPESLIYNKSSLLLGLYQAKKQIRMSDCAIVVEGNFDLISLVAAGCENVVAPLGTALTKKQLRGIKRFTSNVTLLFDGDEAGEKAAVRAVPLFLKEQIAGRVALLPKGHDPDSYVRQYGISSLTKLLEEAKALPEFVVERLVAKHGLSFDGKMKIVGELQPLLEATTSALQRSLFIAHFAENLELSKEELQRLFAEIAPQQEKPSLDKIQAVNNTQFSSSVKEETLRPQQQFTVNQQVVLGFSILYPNHFPELCDAGLHDFFAGGVGETIIAKLQSLFEGNCFNDPDFDPNDLLEDFPEGGAERAFVLRSLNAPAEGTPMRDLEEVLRTLRKGRVARSQKILRKQMGNAEEAGDNEQILQLMSIIKRVRSLEEQIEIAEEAGDSNRIGQLWAELDKIFIEAAQERTL